MVSKTLQDTGERMVPDFHANTIMFAEHMTRYLAAKKLASGKVVLDIASGSGYGTKMLADVAKKVYGVDVSEEAVAYAKEKYNAKNIEYVVGDAEKIPLPDNSVDLVVTFETIEHIKDYRLFLKEIDRVLKKDGLAIVSTPNDEEFAEGNHFHLHEFKLEELAGLLQKTFAHVKAYHQATWVYAQISSEEFIGAEGAVADVEVHNFAPLKPKKYLYFYLLCSHRKIRETIDAIGGLGGHYSARELGDIFAHYQKQIADYKTVYANEQEAHRQTEIRLMLREGENQAIIQSSSYKLARRLAASKQAARIAVGHIRALNPQTQRMLAKNRRYIRRGYNADDFKQAFRRAAESDLAVVLHLYYDEMLPYFIRKLKNLGNINYDLYITIPESAKAADVRAKIHKRLPSARASIVPNCGRDMLPFVQVMRQIEGLGYTKLLKLHTKKSPHRSDGAEWRDKIVAGLLPPDQATSHEIIRILDDPDTGLIGPDGEYVSLLVNMPATAGSLKGLVEKTLGAEKAKLMLRMPDEYGFFAGSMFWARFDAVLGVVNSVDVNKFEPELGQQDSTLAHALERGFNVIPELQGKHFYEVVDNSVKQISYQTTNIPAWSDLSIDSGSPK